MDQFYVTIYRDPNDPRSASRPRQKLHISIKVAPASHKHRKGERTLCGSKLPVVRPSDREIRTLRICVECQSWLDLFEDQG